MKKIIIILITFGLLIFCYPSAERVYTSIMQWRNLISFYYALNQDQEEININQYVSLQELFENNIDENEDTNLMQESIEDAEGQSSEASEIIDNSNELNQEHIRENTIDSSKNIENKINSNLLGTITIDKINAKLPITYGATYSNLKVGAAQIAGTSSLGEVGNSVVSAHRSYTYGRFFNRLDEVEIGDTINILTTKGNYSYKVYEIKIVDPDDVSVLRKNSTDKVLTLITCHPIKVASHRLIVHAVRVD